MIHQKKEPKFEPDKDIIDFAFGNKHLSSEELRDMQKKGFRAFLKTLENPFSERYISAITSCFSATFEKNFQKAEVVEQDFLELLIDALPEDINFKSLKKRVLEKFLEWESLEYADVVPDKAKNYFSKAIYELLDKALSKKGHGKNTVDQFRSKYDHLLEGK